jgi:hypothetical protein
MPKWIPGNFGNNKHSSLALSPSPPRSRSAGRIAAVDAGARELKSVSEDQPTFRPSETINSLGQTASTLPMRSPANVSRQRVRLAKAADYDVLASRAAPTRPHSATAAANRRPQRSDVAPTSGGARALAHVSPRGTSDYVAHTAQEVTPALSLRNSQPVARTRTSIFEAPPASTSAPVSSAEPTSLLSKSMNNMTVAEIRAALMSMPEAVRHNLVDVNTPNSTMDSRAEREKSTSRRDSHRPGTDRRNASQNSSMQEFYDSAQRRGSRKDGERYEHFMGDGYPARGSFYAEDEAQYGGHESQQDDSEGFDGQDAGNSAEESSAHDQLGERDDASEEGHSSYQPRREDAYARQDPRQDPRQLLTRQSASRLDTANLQPGEYDSAEDEDEVTGDDRYDQDFTPVHTQDEDRRHNRGQSRRDSQHRGGDNRGPARRQSQPGQGVLYSGDEENRADRYQQESRAVQDTRRTGAQAQAQHNVSGIPRRVKHEREPEPEIFTFSDEDVRRDYQRVDELVRVHDGRDGRAQRARSAQRVSNVRSHQKDPHAHDKDIKRRPASTSSRGDPHNHSARALRADRHRYLDEQGRKDASEWSRRQASDKRVRSDFGRSPLTASPPGATPLKLKYQSFNNSLEKEHDGPIDDAIARSRQKDRGAHGNSDRHGSAASKAPSQQQHTGQSPERSGGLQMRAESFFQFKNARPGSSPRSSDHVGNQKRGSAAQDVSGNPGPAKAMTTDEFVRANQEMLAQYQAARRSPGRVNAGERASNEGYAAPLQRNAQPPQAVPRTSQVSQQAHTVTNVAEWRRLTEWLQRIGMHKYVEVLKANGVTKLSLVELMQPSDMRQIGIAPQDIPVILNNVTEFTNRTRSLSEQVLNVWGDSPPSSPGASYGSVPAVGVGAQRSAPAASTAAASMAAAGTRGNFTAGQLGRPGPPTRPLFQAPPNTGHSATAPQQPAAAAPVVSKTGKPLKPPYSSLLAKPSVQENAAPVRKFPSVAPITVPRAGTAASSRASGAGEGDSQRVGADDHIFSDLTQIVDELFRCFDTGERELFFHAWKQAALYMPDDSVTLNPLRPAMFHARQVIEFHLHLHFAVFPITHHQGKKAEKLGKLALQRYLESVMLTSELDALNQELPLPSLRGFSPTAKAGTGSSEGASATASEENALRLNTTISSFPSPSPSRPFIRSREYAIYAGMVLVPEPEQNVAFQGLFQPDWMESLKERLRQFLQLVRPNVEIVPTVANSVVGSVEQEGRSPGAGAAVNSGTDEGSGPAVPSTERAPFTTAPGAPFIASQSEPPVAPHVHARLDDVHSEIGGGASVKSGREKIRTYLHAREPPPPVPAVNALDDFNITFSSPVAEKGDEHDAAVVPSPPLSAIKPHSATASPTVNPAAQARPQTPPVVKPEKIRPVPALDLTGADQPLPPTNGTTHRISRINSPASPVSSVISQLTDDSPRPSGAHHGARSDFPVLPAVASSPVQHASPTSAEKRSKKPFAEKPRMQSQVDSYNRMLRQGAAGALRSASSDPADDGAAPGVAVEQSHGGALPAAPSQVGVSSLAPVGQSTNMNTGAGPVAAPTAAPRAAVISRRASTQSVPTAAAPTLNLGFGMRRKSASDSGPPSIGLAAQVAKYNRLLSKGLLTSGPTVGSAAATGSSGAAPVEEARTSPTERSVSGGEHDEGNELSTSQMLSMEDAVLEMQEIYGDTLPNGQRASTVSGENEALPAERSTVLAE